jgi:transposase-like protein
MTKGSGALADRSGRETGSMTTPGRPSVLAGFRFPREMISVAARWYLRYGLSHRDPGELLAERGITVAHVTVYRLRHQPLTTVLTLLPNRAVVGPR